MSILVTGAAGFIGANFVRLLATKTKGPIIALDALTYAGNRENLAGLNSEQVLFSHTSICDQDGFGCCL